MITNFFFFSMLIQQFKESHNYNRELKIDSFIRFALLKANESPTNYGHFRGVARHLILVLGQWFDFERDLQNWLLGEEELRSKRNDRRILKMEIYTFFFPKLFGT